MVAGNTGAQFRPRVLEIPFQLGFSLLQAGLGLDDLLLAFGQFLLLVAELLPDLLPARIVDRLPAGNSTLGRMTRRPTRYGACLLVLRGFGSRPSGLFPRLGSAQGVNLGGQGICLVAGLGKCGAQLLAAGGKLLGGAT